MYDEYDASLAKEDQGKEDEEKERIKERKRSSSHSVLSAHSTLKTLTNSQVSGVLQWVGASNKHRCTCSHLATCGAVQYQNWTCVYLISLTASVRTITQRQLSITYISFHHSTNLIDQSYIQRQTYIFTTKTY